MRVWPFSPVSRMYAIIPSQNCLNRVTNSPCLGATPTVPPRSNVAGTFDVPPPPDCCTAVLCATIPLPTKLWVPSISISKTSSCVSSFSIASILSKARFSSVPATAITSPALRYRTFVQCIS